MNFNFSSSNTATPSNPGGVGTRQFADSKTVSRIGLMIGIILTLLGGVLVFTGNQSKDWPSTTGKVTYVTSHIKNNNSSDTSSSKTTYEDTIIYSVDGKEYPASLTTSNEDGVGSDIRVKYNPSNPAQYQIGEVGMIGWILAGGGAVLAVASLIAVIVTSRK